MAIISSCFHFSAAVNCAQLQSQKPHILILSGALICLLLQASDTFKKLLIHIQVPVMCSQIRVRLQNTINFHFVQLRPLRHIASGQTEFYCHISAGLPGNMAAHNDDDKKRYYINVVKLEQRSDIVVVFTCRPVNEFKKYFVLCTVNTHTC